MAITRIYQQVELTRAAHVELDEKATHHVIHVMRLRMGDQLKIFNGKGDEFLAEIVEVTKRRCLVHITEPITAKAESSLNIHLLQAIPRGEKMDFILQKAIELGVQKITPIFSQRCNVKLAAERLAKRMQHWQGVIISACEQSGRTIIPSLQPATNLADALARPVEHLAFILNPYAAKRLCDFSAPAEQKITLLIGPEGGLADTEIQLAEQQGFHSLALGPRILRTETAPLAIITALQCRWGDMG